MAEEEVVEEQRKAEREAEEERKAEAAAPYFYPNISSLPLVGPGAPGPVAESCRTWDSRAETNKAWVDYQKFKNSNSKIICIKFSITPHTLLMFTVIMPE